MDIEQQVIKWNIATSSTSLASKCLLEVIDSLSENYCPEQAGFEGADTFLECDSCVVCAAKLFKANATNQGLDAPMENV